jgi:1-acyl-sn-glycerol-3-phosphate acyltransferase
VGEATMIDLGMLRSLSLSAPAPRLNRRLLDLLSVDYRRGTEVVVEGLERLPQDEPVFIAMNHTDRFSYGPLMWELHRRGLPRYLATWIKGKYFKNPAMSRLFLHTGNIPIPSRGYLIAAQLQLRTGAVLDPVAYRTLRRLVDGEEDVDVASIADLTASWGGPVVFAAAIRRLFADLMYEVLRLHREAFGEGMRHVLVFPEGTRTPRLIEGRTGLVEVSQQLGVPIVPIACSGGDRLYPGNVPLSSGGKVVYRVGHPLRVDGPELGPHRITAPFVPFSPEAGSAHGVRFRALTDIVMAHIDGMLDEQYRRLPEA